MEYFGTVKPVSTESAFLAWALSALTVVFLKTQSTHFI
jgi:hypothetical protein